MNLTISFFICGHLRETKQVETPCTIGRSSQSDWVLGHPMLSRKHCILFDKNGELLLRDEGSLNGVRVKGSRIKESVRLQLGDEFTVGSDLLFRISVPVVNEQFVGSEHAEQTTAVFVKDEFTSRQSTVLIKEPPVEEQTAE